MYKFDLRTRVQRMQTMSIFPATGNNFLENLSESLVRILSICKHTELTLLMESLHDGQSSIKRGSNSSCVLFCCTFFVSCASCILCDKILYSSSSLKHLKIQTDTADLNVLNPEILQLQYCAVWVKT